MDSCSLWGRRVLHTSTAVGPWTLVGNDWDCTRGWWDCWALCMLQKAEQSQVRMERNKERLGWATKQKTSSRDKREWMAERGVNVFLKRKASFGEGNNHKQKRQIMSWHQRQEISCWVKGRGRWGGGHCVYCFFMICFSLEVMGLDIICKFHLYHRCVTSGSDYKWKCKLMPHDRFLWKALLKLPGEAVWACRERQLQ